MRECERAAATRQAHASWLTHLQSRESERALEEERGRQAEREDEAKARAQAAEARLKEADAEVPPGPARRDAMPLRGGGAALQ
jgi:hypothetical protein